jgi:glycosyltransferase involved in cell wall biosynthesis
VKIAQVAPLYESVPPKLYGGTERVVSYLTEELVRQGHDVTLFASGDSTTKARLVPICEQSLRLDKDCIDHVAHHIRMLNAVFERASEFDVLHFHIDYLHYPLSVRQKVPHVTTLHGRLDLPDLQPLYRDFKTVPLVSISNAQRCPIEWANWRATVYHGLPDDLYALQEKAGEYLAFVGRISPEKRVDRAIEIARRSGRRLRIAAKVDNVDEKYFQERIEPLLGQPGIEFIGEIGEKEKQEFVGGAAAMLLPIDWPEPFGLTMIEAMACGVPTIVWNEGSAPEIIDHGVTGFVVESIEEAASAVESAVDLDRRAIRRVFERRFPARRMARDYIGVYRTLIESGATQVAA